MIKPRYRIFLDELPKNKNKIVQSAIKAGYSKSYANKGGKTLMNNAIKANARAIIKQVENKEITASEVSLKMYEIMGYSSSEVIDRLRMVADQEKDLASKLKVLAPLAKELGVILQAEEAQVNVTPTLNITVEKSKDVSNNSPVEPLNKGDVV